MDWTKYKFRDRWGQLAIYDTQWKLLSWSELKILADELITLCDLAREEGSQEKVIDKAWIDYLRRTIKSATWFFIPPKKALRPHRGCIYFLRDPQNPSVTKVGYTTEISQRIRALSGIVTNNDHKLELIAVAYTDDYKLLEQAMHRYLAQYHTEGEWFLSDGVDAALMEITQLVRK